MTGEPLSVLIAAIAAKWADTPALQTAISGPWFGERPADAQENPASGTQYPYAIFPADLNRCRLANLSCGTEYYEHDIVIRVYDQPSVEDVQARVAAVKAVYDSDTLSLTLGEGSLVSHRPEGDGRYVEDDKNVWHFDISYNFVTSRSRVA